MSTDLKVLATRISNWWKSNRIIIMLYSRPVKSIKRATLSYDTFNINSESNFEMAILTLSE